MHNIAFTVNFVCISIVRLLYTHSRTIEHGNISLYEENKYLISLYKNNPSTKPFVCTNSNNDTPNFEHNHVIDFLIYKAIQT